MPKQNRNTLKSFFSDGAMPSSDMFEDLIDSGINISDDGFEKNAKDGWKISTTGDAKTLLSLYDQKDRETPEWGIQLEGMNNQLVIGYPGVESADGSAGAEESAATFCHAISLHKTRDSVRMGVGHQLPHDTLDVAGNVRADGQRGRFGRSFQSVKADRQWYSITGPINDGIALEVMARAINREKKYYGMMHAIALHSPWRAKRNLSYFLGLKNRIRYTHGFYDSMLHKLKLRWRRLPGEVGYRLQIRSNCDYGSAGVLDFHITCLWSEDDHFIAPEADPGEATDDAS